MNRVEKIAKTVDEAIIEALKDLKCTYEEVDVEVVEQGARGIFGIGSKNAKVIVKKKFDPQGVAKRFLTNIFDAMKLDVNIETALTEKNLHINLSGSHMGILIGKRGQTLDSLQYLVNLVVNKGEAQYVSITLDTEDYRKRRRETLESLAFNLARKVKKTRKSIVLEPMNPYERRVIHAALQGDKTIKTYSEGEEPYRNVIITLRT